MLRTIHIQKAINRDSFAYKFTFCSFDAFVPKLVDYTAKL